MSTLVLLISVTKQCVENEYEINPSDFVSVSLIYMTISIAFLVTGLLMLKTTRDHYEQFYKDYGTWLWVSTLALSIPIFLRSVNLLMMSYSWYYALYEIHYTIMISIYVFAFNVFPFVM